LYALYPSHQISVDKTPELAKAAAETLKCRMDNGGGYTGWSCAWIISFYARLRDKEHAYGALKKLLTQSTYPNLMDNHPTKDGSAFQIDGNLGACAGMLEMLIQTDELGTITQFPALPVQWKSGKIKGLKLPGGKTINISW
jgi:alpha-L-fucosidase 2